MLKKNKMQKTLLVFPPPSISIHFHPFMMISFKTWMKLLHFSLLVPLERNTKHHREKKVFALGRFGSGMLD
jgi:hypothetical protein